MFRMLHILVWAPFGLAANPKAMAALFIAGSLYSGTWFNFPLFFVLMIVHGACLPLELKLRPFFAPKKGRGGMPSRAKPIAPSLVRIAVRIKGRAPRLRRIVRQLAPELRTLLTARAGEPEAIAHERRMLADGRA